MSKTKKKCADKCGCKTKATKVKAAKVKAAKVKAAKPKATNTKPAILLNVPNTKKQMDGIVSVVKNSFEGTKRIDHLPLKDQIDTVFNPLHSITKTTVSAAVSDSTYIVDASKMTKSK